MPPSGRSLTIAPVRASQTLTLVGMPAARGRPPAVRAEHGAVQGRVWRQGAPHGLVGRSTTSAVPERSLATATARPSWRTWARVGTNGQVDGPGGPDAQPPRRLGVLADRPAAQAAEAAGQQLAAIRAGDEADRVRPPIGQEGDLPAGGQVPQAGPVVHPDGEQPVRADVSLAILASTGAQAADERTVLPAVRHLHQPRPSADDDEPAHRPVPAEVHVADAGGPVDQRPARLGVPQPARAVPRTGHQEVAARVERHPAHPLGVALQGDQGPSTGRIPDLDPARGAVETDAPADGRPDARRGRKRIPRRRRAARSPSSRNRCPRPRRRPRAPVADRQLPAVRVDREGRRGDPGAQSTGSPGPSAGPTRRSSRRAERPPTGCCPR